MRVDSKRPRWLAAVRHLRACDPAMASLIDEVGPCKLAIRPPTNPFMALAEVIVYQQLTGKAAATIFGRVTALFPGKDFPTPEELLALPADDLRAAGLSGAKTAAVRDLAERIRDGVLPLDELPEMPDEQVIETLSAVRGIGRWSAEMYLLFRLGRTDILPVGDLGLQKGVERLYGLSAPPKPTELERIAEPWRPYRSIATWYFWARANAKP